MWIDTGADERGFGFCLRRKITLVRDTHDGIAEPKRV
jgi:hypothetical protein